MGGRDGKTARERILDAAAQLFYREGVRAVGIDTVIDKAGVAKMSLYRAFPSKDDLVAAYLEDVNARYWRWFDEVMARHPESPRRQLAELFASLAKRTTSPHYRGCPFVNTAVEFPDPAHPGRAVALANKRELRRRLRELVERLPARDPAVLADQLLLLTEGAYSSANTMGTDGPAAAVALAAEALIDAQMRRNCDPAIAPSF